MLTAGGAVCWGSESDDGADPRDPPTAAAVAAEAAAGSQQSAGLN